jgi:chromosome segregation ATPase
MDINKITTELEDLQKKRAQNQKQRDMLEGQKKQILEQLKSQFEIESADQILTLLKDKRKLRDDKGVLIETEYNKLKEQWRDV